MCGEVVDCAREVCGFVKVERKNPKNEWYDDEVKAAIGRKNVLGIGDQIVKNLMKWKRNWLEYVHIGLKNCNKLKRQN